MAKAAPHMNVVAAGMLPHFALFDIITMQAPATAHAAFQKNYEVFGYNLYLEENLSKTASNKEVRKAKDNLWKKYF